MTNLAIDATLKYFESGRIATHIAKFAGGLNLDYIDTYYDLALKYHERMDREINQNVIGSIPEITIELLEHLQSWLGDWRFLPGYNSYIEIIIDNRNTEIFVEYDKEITEEEEKFRAKTDYTKDHNYEYEIDNPMPYNFGIFGSSNRPAKITRKNSWFYCNEKKPATIDKQYLPDYLKLLREIVESFKQIANKYINRYDQNKIPSLWPINRGKNQVLLSPIPTKEAPEPFPEIKKLKFNLSVPQLAYLFKLLYDLNLLEVKTKAELKRFIMANFSTKMSEDISDSSLANKLSETQKAEANYWADIFITMHKAAKKFRRNYIS